MESYNRQSSTEGVVCSSGMTSMAQNLRRLPTHSEQVVCILWAIFDVQTSYGGLKVSKFNQESISEVSILLR